MSEEIDLNDLSAPIRNTSSTRAEYVIQQFNVVNAKKIAFLLVIGFIVYHGLLNWHYGSDSCQWLLSKGRYKGNNEWQPFGCMIHKYTQTDIRRCLRYLAFWGNRNHFIFVGDSSIYLLYLNFINHLYPNEDNNITTTDPPKFTEFEEHKVNMRIAYIYADQVTNHLYDQITKIVESEVVPAVLIAGFTHHYFLYGNVTDELLTEYTVNLTQLVPPFDRLASLKTKVLWKLQDHVNEDKLPPSWQLIENDDIDRLNHVARTVFRPSKTIVWEAALQISNGLLDSAVNGYSLSPLGLQHEIQVLLNMYCNDYMNYNDGTCCSNTESYTNLQIISYSVLGVCIVLGLGVVMHRWYRHIRGQTFYTPLPQQHNELDTTNTASLQIVPTGFNLATLIVSLGLLGFIMVYFYICDRTNFFMKENKYYSEFSFWIPVGYVFALGLFFTEDSRYTKVLNRDQTDELKGWILLVVLIYYVTGARRVLPIHMNIKLLISSYFFLTGYSHFTHMWQTGNCGFIRFSQVMFRLNFLTVVLCFCMNRPYQFYYFVPLLTFWVCIIYFLLALPPRISSQSVDLNALHYLYLVVKLVACISVITILFMSEVFFQRIFVTRPWKALFVNSDDDINEWWYQWKLDRYTVTFGMIFATCFHIAQKYGFFDDNNRGNLTSRRTSIFLTLLAVISIGFYTAFSFFCRNEQNCEEIHSYLLFIPIVGYIILRNISGIVRTRYSTFFAWFGSISLELFICQYHIWLAADRHGVLVLLPGFPTLNMIITSFIFVCASHEIHRVTEILLPYAVPNDWKYVMRNFFLFLLILLPLGRYDGMF